MVSPPSTLKETEWQQLLSVAVEASGIAITDANGIIMWVNLAFAQLTGYAIEEAIGQNPRLLKSGTQDSAYYADLWETIASGKTWCGELTNRRKDGSHYVEEMTITPLLAKDGEITHYVAIKQDISARRDAEDKVRESETRHNALLESLLPLMTELKDVTTALDQARSEMHAMLNATNEAMILISPDDEILWINHAFESFFEIKAEEAINRKFISFLSHWEKIVDEPSVITAILKYTGREKILDDSVAVTQKWPQKRELEVYSTRVESVNHEYLGQLFVFSDVTHKREVERMKSEFVSLISHEFRTPLTSIRGYTEMLLEGDAGELTNDQMEFLRTVFRNATHLAELVDELLEVSRIEAGAVKLNPAPLDIVLLIDDSVDRLRLQFEEKKQKTKIEVRGDLPQVEGDAHRVSQILMNLLSNAHKYTPSGGRISIVVQLVGKLLRIDVTDTGIGISEEEQEKLFTKFFRADNPETIKAGGTGLGLWITRSLVEMHGGELSVVSKPGKGSTFTFTLPISQK